MPEGWTNVVVGGERHTANFVKEYVNVLRREGEQPNVLADVLRSWFGPNAGRPGTRFAVRFEPHEDGYEVRPLEAPVEFEPES